MPETINVLGKPLPKNAVIAAGAVTVGIVGYAWFTKGKSAGSETVEPSLPDPVPVPTDDTDFSVSGGGPPPTTNAQWSENAIAKLIAYGLDAAAVSAAIGKFLQRKPLNTIEQSLVQQAIGAAGNPPENGPWVILEEGPAPNTPSTPSGSLPGLVIGSPSISRDQITWTWSSVTGANYYTVYPIKVSQGNSPLELRVVDKTEFTWYNANPAEQYQIVVTAYNDRQQEIAHGSAYASTPA